jgi:hypothetical protein
MQNHRQNYSFVYSDFRREVYTQVSPRNVYWRDNLETLYYSFNTNCFERKARVRRSELNSWDKRSQLCEHKLNYFILYICKNGQTIIIAIFILHIRRGQILCFLIYVNCYIQAYILYIFPPNDVSALSWWWGFCESVTQRAMPAVV